MYPVNVVGYMASKHDRDNATNAGSRELEFYVSNSTEINEKFHGKHIAIIGDRVVASGDNPGTVWEHARKMYPRSRPTLAYVPEDDILVLV